MTMTANFETDTEVSHALISWRSVMAGLLISFLAMAGLIGLGLAFGGINLDADTSARSIGMFSGIWFIASAFISLFAGSYFAARVSKFRLGRIGSAQGLVIAALFLGFFFYQILSGIGVIGQVVERVSPNSMSHMAESAGWSLFFLVALGSLSGILGGALGSVANFRKPLVREDFVRRNLHVQA